MGLDSMNDIEIDVDDWITDSFAGINRESTRTSWERHQELRGLGATASDWQVKLMQQTLAQLGRQANDTSISSIVADGVMGPKTAAAVNRALSVHVNTNTTQYLRSGKLSQDAIVQNVVVIAGALASEVIRRGDVPAEKKTTVAKTTPKKPVPQVTPTYAPPTDPWYVVHKTKLMIGGGVLLALGAAFTVFSKPDSGVSDY